MMDFCGRIKEIAGIKRVLEQGKNIVITGRFGIGRTCLVRHVAKLNLGAWRFLFADFSQTPAKMCNDLLNQLAQNQKSGKHQEYTAYKTCRSRMAALGPADRAHVIVVDNIAKLTSPKLTFLRHLHREKRFLFIVIAEGFLSENDLFELRSSLLPAELLVLRNLKRQETLRFFRNFSEKHDLFWSESRIRELAIATGGYPLMMEEYLEKERERAKANRDAKIR